MLAIAMLIAVLAFLVPVGIYCFFLASINQRPRPTMVSGRWDALGLAFAASGFFLITIPSLAAELYARFAGILVSDLIFDIWSLLWLAYYLFVISGAWLMTMLRADKTTIYHVDPLLFDKILERALANLGLDKTTQSRRLVIHPVTRNDEVGSTAIAAARAASSRPEDRRHAELVIDAFPAMCHVTVHWENYTAEVRQEIEQELEKGLVLATPDENPAAGWFLSVSGMIFGALVMVVVLFGSLVMLGKI